MIELDPATIANVTKHLQANGAAKRCEACRYHGLSVAKRLVHVPLFDAASGIPSVVVTCGRCGRMSFHVAALLGITVTQVEQPAEVPKDATLPRLDLSRFAPPGEGEV